MRTTLTLDADVAKLLDDEVHRRRLPFKQVVNDALRRGLSPGGRGVKPSKYKVDVYHSQFAAGIDPGSLNRLNDELDTEAQVETMRREREKSR